MPSPDPELPFFVYGTLLPGEPNHDLLLRGRAVAEQPAVLPGALLYDGPGYPYAIDGHGAVRGTLVTAAPAVYAELLVLLDRLEEYAGPGHPRNLYERVAREVRLPGAVPPAPATARAWVYLAAPPVTRSLRTGGTLIPGGSWITRRRPPPPAPHTP
ncbi:gamma-glutamylcyclotransferase [Streptomyces sp. JH14]|uniref:gamma-glutamylcyclotransferase family protein n=1 Tax=Streptomyces sp. JH14 TaxID=2793630 RepID=UPI0023F92A4F|nr:gamma-glutamylcyclotransferase family protein [Streptomyces sp. JH14]MDF6042344.1 gamma-glutamylcyclotransferase [Streptomyces sp. JH14]